MPDGHSVIMTMTFFLEAGFPLGVCYSLSILGIKKINMLNELQNN